jgi:Nif11 domain
MAEKTAQTFINDLENNTSLSSQFYAASPGNFEAVIDFAITKDYIFTKDELVKAIIGIQKAK